MSRFMALGAIVGTAGHDGTRVDLPGWLVCLWAVAILAVVVWVLMPPYRIDDRLEGLRRDFPPVKGPSPRPPGEDVE